MTYELVTAYIKKHDYKESEITYAELQDCAKSPFFLLLTLMCKCQLFDYCTHSFEEFDDYTRAGDESFVVHAWYCDLWVCIWVCIHVCVCVSLFVCVDSVCGCPVCLCV